MKRSMRYGLLALGGYLLLRDRFQNPSLSYHDKTVLISGGSRGLGLVFARQLISQGARVIALGRDTQSLNEAQKEFSDLEYTAVECDVGDPSQVQDALERIKASYSHIDVLIHNAGVMQVGPFETMTEEDYQESLSTHFWGAYNLIRSTLSMLQLSPEPKVIFINSIGGKIGVPHMAPYAAGKFAQRGFAQAIAPELEKLGIGLTIAFPAVMRTGSPLHVLYRGSAVKERFWFTAIDALPLISISAENAATGILKAAALGRREVHPGWLSKVAVKVDGIFPSLVNEINRRVLELLPQDKSRGGYRGYELPRDKMLEQVAPLNDLASVRNNQL